MHTTMRSCFVLCTATLAGVVPSAAQQSLELSTFAGVHVPSTHVIGLYGFCPGDGKGLVTQNPASVVGARVTAWTGRRLGVDLSLDVSGPQATNVWGAKGSIMTGSARLLLGLTPRASSTSFYVAAGLGLVDHRGAAYSYGSSAGASVGPVVGAGGRFRLAPTLALRADVDDYVYGFSRTQSATAPFAQNPLQNELAISAGISLTPFGHSEVAR